MNHIEVEKQDIVERFVRRQLSAEERRAFQEHFLECDECFTAVEVMAKFVAGVRHSAQKGILANPTAAQEESESWWNRLFSPMIVLSATACLLLAAGITWLLFRPSSRTELSNAIAKPQVQTSSSEKAPSTPVASRVADRDQVEDKLAQNRPANSPPPLGTIASITLNATRNAGGAAQVKLGPNLAALALRMEVAVGAYEAYQLELVDSNGRVVRSVGDLRSNSQGTLLARVATQQLSAGKYRVKLFGSRKQQKDFVGEYDLILQD